MLNWFEEYNNAEKIEIKVLNVLKEGKISSPDIGENYPTKDLVQASIKVIP